MARADKDKPRVSKLAGATAKSTGEEEREDLFPEPGKYHVKFRECSSPEPVAGKSWEGLLVKVTGAGKNKKLGDVTQIYTTTQKALSQSAPRLRSLCRSLIGLGKQDDEAFGEFDPHGEFADTIYSNDMQAAAEYWVANRKAVKGPKDVDDALERLTNAEIEAVVTKGGDTDDGDWYRNTTFRPLAEESDEDDDSDDEDDDAPESEPTPKAKAGKKKASKRAPVEDEDDEDEDSDDEDDEDDAPDSEPESERRPAKKKKKKARRK